MNRMTVTVRPSDAEAPGYYDVHPDMGALERALGGDPMVARLARKHGLTRREALRTYVPQAHRDPGTGDVSMNAGYDAGHDEGRLELAVWAELEAPVRTALAKERDRAGA